MIREKLIEFIPPRFHKRNGFRYLYTFALVADATLESCHQAVSARFPGFGTDTALSRISRDRGIRQGFAETAASFAARVVTWITDHQKQGSAFELMRQVQGYCGPKKPRLRHVIVKGAPYPLALWRTLNADGTTEQEIRAVNFDWDGDDADNTFTSRAWLIIYSTGSEAPWARAGTWASGAAAMWDDDAGEGTWGSAAELSHIQGIRDIVRDWKGAQSLYHEVIVCFDDAAFDPLDGMPPNPDGLWHYYSKNVAGAQVMARSTSSVYWAGTA